MHASECYPVDFILSLFQIVFAAGGGVGPKPAIPVSQTVTPNPQAALQNQR